MTTALLAMAFAFFNAGQPVLDAFFFPGLDPSGMERCREWEKAQGVGLGGLDGGSVQDSRVSVLWNSNWLFFEFACTDRAVVAPGTADGLDHFRMGDTAEVFVARRGDKSYAEIHATPSGRKTVYFCSDYRQPASLPDAAGKISVAAAGLPRGWRALFAVPRDLFGKIEDGDEYDVFFGRYDYATEGGKPDLSSYPAHRGGKPDFHRRANYAILRLKP